MNRKGSIYFLTLSSAVLMMTMVLGLSVLIIKQRRVARVDSAVEEATICAELGIRHALYFTKEASNWRSLLSSGSWMTNVPNGPATYSLDGIDTADGILNNGPDLVQLTCTADVGGVRRSLQVDAAQAVSELLRYGAASGTEVKVSQSSRINGNAASNGDIAVVGGSALINGNAEAVTGVSGNVTGTVVPNSSPRDFPDKAAIMQYYYGVATQIPYQASISGILLSPTNNPLGPTNPDGVYLIYCNGNGIGFSNCRIVGTIILDNCSGGSSVSGGVNWQPARPDYPALIINQQGINIYPDSTLSEGSLGIDLSLPGESGFGSLGETFPNRIMGTIYVDGYLYLYNSAHVVGPVITTGFCQLQNSAVIDANPGVYDNPPPGFLSSCLVAVSDSWQQVASPEPEPGNESATSSSSTSSLTGGGDEGSGKGKGKTW